MTQGLYVSAYFSKQEPRSSREWRALREAKANNSHPLKRWRSTVVIGRQSHSCETRSQSDQCEGRVKAAYRLLEARYLFWSIRLGDLRIGMIVHSSLAIAGSCRSVL